MASSEHETVVTATFTLSGDVADYDSAKQKAIRTVFALAAGANATDVTLSIAPASVALALVIAASDAAAASSIQSTLSAGILSSPSSLLAALEAGGVSGVTVESAIRVTMTSRSGETERMRNVLIGIAVALVAACALACLLGRGRLRRPSLEEREEEGEKEAMDLRRRRVTHELMQVEVRCGGLGVWQGAGSDDTPSQRVAALANLTRARREDVNSPLTAALEIAQRWRKARSPQPRPMIYIVSDEKYNVEEGQVLELAPRGTPRRPPEEEPSVVNCNTFEGTAEAVAVSDRVDKGAGVGLDRSAKAPVSAPGPATGTGTENTTVANAWEVAIGYGSNTQVSERQKSRDERGSAADRATHRSSELPAPARLPRPLQTRPLSRYTYSSPSGLTTVAEDDEAALRHGETRGEGSGLASRPSPCTPLLLEEEEEMLQDALEGMKQSVAEAHEEEMSREA